MGVARDYSSKNSAKRGHPPVYQCKNLDMRRNLANVDEMVEAVVLDRLRRPDALSLLTPTEDAGTLAAESQEIRARIQGLAALYAEGILTAAAVREQKGKLQTRLDSLQTRLHATEGGTILADLVTADSVESFWHDRMTIQNKRRVVAALVSVTIMPTQRGGNNAFRPEDVVIEWKTP